MLAEKTTKWQQRIKIIAILGLIKGSCVFATSDFPAENPRTQKRNYSYTNRCMQCRKTPIINENEPVLD